MLGITVNWTLRNKLRQNFNQNTKRFMHECIWKQHLRNGGHFVEGGKWVKEVIPSRQMWESMAVTVTTMATTMMITSRTTTRDDDDNHDGKGKKWQYWGSVLSNLAHSCKIIFREKTCLHSGNAPDIIQLLMYGVTLCLLCVWNGWAIVQIGIAVDFVSLLS